MPEYIEIYLQCNKELDRICIKKHFEKKVQNLLKNWLKELIFSYKKENNFLEDLSLEEYVMNYFYYLKNLESINIFEIEDVLNNMDNYFYKEIFKPQKKEDYYFAPFHMRKENDEYVLDNQGDYILTTVGVALNENRCIQLINVKNMPLYFHHELTHIGQFLCNKYQYPAIFSYAKEIQTMFLEADAYFQEKVFLGESFVFLEDWNEQSIKLKKSAFYCQLYILIFLFVPEKIWIKWKSEGINLNLVPDKFRFVYSEFFTIITLLIAKSNCIDGQEDKLMEAINDGSDLYYPFGKYLSSNIKKFLHEDFSVEILFAMLIQKTEDFLNVVEDEKRVLNLKRIKSFYKTN